MDKNGSCHDCYTKSAQPVQGVESNCDACLNRFVDNANQIIANYQVVDDAVIWAV